MTNSEPTFKNIFGKNWGRLPGVMHRHYANRPFTNDVNICYGKLSVYSAFILRLFAPLFHILGGIPVVSAKDIPVTVRFESDEESSSFHFIRTFHFPDKRQYIFHSRMQQIDGNRVVEIMKFRLCWCMKYLWQADKVILAHDGFSLYLFGKFMPLPITWLVGRIHAEEEALSETRFKMFVEIRHWLFGKIYEYRGEFEMDTNND